MTLLLNYAFFAALRSNYVTPEPEPNLNGFCLMRLLATVAGVCLWTLAVSPSAAGDDPASARTLWLRDLDEALNLAKSSDRDILINFTGRGWCYYCELLEREVFAKPEFASINEHFVLIEVDFPSEKTGDADSATISQKRLWRSKYFAPAVPTVVIADRHVTTGRLFRLFEGRYRRIIPEASPRVPRCSHRSRSGVAAG